MTEEEKLKRELELRRSLTSSEGIDKTNYKSPLNQDVMTVKGGSPKPDPVTRIKNSTQHIDTKSPLRIGDAAEVMKANADKIADMRRLKALKALKALPAIGTVVGLASAGERAYAGDMDSARDELASAIDPTGISDGILMVKDYVDERLDNRTANQMRSAEFKAANDYRNSPAARDREAAIEAMLQRMRTGEEAPELPVSSNPSLSPEVVEEDDLTNELLERRRRLQRMLSGN